MQARTSLALFALLACAACASDADRGAKEPDESAEADGSDTPDSTGQPDGEPIPLLLWVDDLVENDTNDSAAPDTVDDKNIENTEDPSAFDHLLEE